MRKWDLFRKRIVCKTFGQDVALWATSCDDWSASDFFVVCSVGVGWILLSVFQTESEQKGRTAGERSEFDQPRSHSRFHQVLSQVTFSCASLFLTFLEWTLNFGQCYEHSHVPTRPYVLEHNRPQPCFHTSQHGVQWRQCCSHTTPAPSSRSRDWPEKGQ